MPRIDADAVRAIARLARLELAPAEVARFQTELSTILDYVARLDALDPGPPDEPSPPDHPLRSDAVEPWPDPAVLHREAPDFANGFYRVPRVVE